jgi:hypothetical protein
MATANDTHDARLATLLNELTDVLHNGAQPDLDAVCRQNPDLADELRQVWTALRFTEAFGNRTGAATTALAPATRLSHEPDDDLPRIFGDYDLLEKVGCGGMGVVYRARQRSLGRTVAVKMMRRELATAADLARFRAEPGSAARLDHPNIVSVYDVGACDGHEYFSMQYVEGETLAQRIARVPLSPREAAALMIPICRAVHHAHQAGILHRDLKPSNVLLDHEGKPHVTDFGLAKRVTGGPELTLTGVLVGTPSYMAPEQAVGQRGVIGPATDVYALGTILYELLTGHPPFRATTLDELRWAILEQEPVPPRIFNRQIDRELEMICMKCLQKPPDLRYQAAGQLASDLEAYLRGEPTSARPSGVAFFVNRVLRDTPHAAVLENWGVLWMWHSLAIFVLCLITNVMLWKGVHNPWPYLLPWGAGLVTWAGIFWTLRRRGGPVTFVERQFAHAWGGGVLASIALFFVELLLHLDALTLSPMLALFAGMVFINKAGTLSGSFYFAAAAYFVTAGLMALFPEFGILLFGTVSAVCFFVPGYKYHRQRIRALREGPKGSPKR